MKRIFYQGERGCFSELAAEKFFDSPIEGIGVPTFEAVFEAVKNERDGYGIIPIENALTGSIHQNYDLILKYDLWIVGEVRLKITFNLLAHPGVPLASIKEVWSHPVALDQCKEFFARHPEYKVVPVYDTAGAAKILEKEKRTDVGILAGPQVAKLYGLQVLEQKVEDNPQNFTRFLILSREKKICAGQNVKTSIVFGVKNAPGILFKCLSVFALRNIDLAKLESRPIIGKPWEYLFYIDLKGSIEDENCKGAVENFSEVVVYLKILGSYELKW